MGTFRVTLTRMNKVVLERIASKTAIARISGPWESISPCRTIPHHGADFVKESTNRFCIFDFARLWDCHPAVPLPNERHPGISGMPVNTEWNSISKERQVFLVGPNG